MTNSFKTTLLDGAEKLNIAISVDQAEKLFDFYQTVVEYNKKVNLTAVTDELGFINKHILDSLFAQNEFGNNLSVVDIGAGAGFPSIPLKIMRDDLSFTLLEATGKKVDFLNTVIDRFCLENVSAVHVRAEDAGKELYRNKFDVAVSRAVGKISLLLEYGIPLLKTGGRLFCYKGPDLSDIDGAKTAVKKLNCCFVKTVSYELSDDTGKRNLVVYKKSGITPNEYPRPSAKIAKFPL